jgi:hypothetical protein
MLADAKLVCTNRDSLPCNYTYTYSSLSTPEVGSVQPSSIDDSALVVLSGSKFGNSVENIKVFVGSIPCSVNYVNESYLECELAGLMLGSQLVSINVNGKKNSQRLVSIILLNTTQIFKNFSLKGLGNSSINNDLFITGLLNIKSISPQFGSINGGTMLTIRGNGFSSNPNSTVVMLNSRVCAPVKIDLNEIVCTTPEGGASPNSASISLRF